MQSSSSASSELSVQQVSVPAPWGSIKVQVFGDASNPHAKPVLCLHGYLDNSQSFRPMAPFICDSNRFYMIAVDFPGHGLSSRSPDGLAYAPKFFLTAVRRVVKHFALKNFYMCSHSYGVGMSLLYDTVFGGEVRAIAGIDFIMSMADKRRDIADYWHEGIEAFINTEDQLAAVDAATKSRRYDDKAPLTRDSAVSM